MFRVYACLVDQHSAGSVAGAAMVCMITSITAIALLLHSRNGAASSAAIWRGLAAASFGGGIWATHFIALLGYEPALPIGFDILGTIVSALLPMAASYAAFAGDFATSWRLAAKRGVMIGCGAGAMHYLGMEALRVPGTITYAFGYVITSVILASLCATGASRVLKSTLGGAAACAALLMLATVLLHYIGMAAVFIHPDPSIGIPTPALSRSALAGVIGGAAALLIVSVLIAAIVDMRLAAAEGSRLRQLADAAFEGIATCEDLIVTDANAALADMLHCKSASLRGMNLRHFFAEEADADFDGLLLRAEAAPVSTVLAGSAAGIPIELRVRRLAGRGRPAIVVAMRDLRERNAAEARIRYMAHHDPLTGLANRAKLRERLEQELANCRRTERCVAVCCLDLDRFKIINDTYGHAAGDALLRETARRLLAEARESDVVARLGGDEFVIVQTGLIYPEAAQRLARRLIESLAIPVDVGDGQISYITASIGIAIYPEDGRDIDALMVSADLALYRAKEEGKNTFAFFSPDMDATEQARRALEQDVRQALERREFGLAFQPQCDLTSGATVGFEALLRWQKPGHGPISPSLFIPAAESSGAIIPIGAWVLRQACAEAAKWRPELRVAVNVSTAQFQQAGFAGFVAQTLAETGLDPARLELELTETFLMRDTELAIATLHEIRALGVLIALDDFGTGYSSLSMLRSFPFDRIKLDRAFVTDVATSTEASALVAALISLTAGLNVPLLAEGIEDEKQLAALRKLGCAEAQGYFLGRPEPIGVYAGVTGAAATKEMSLSF
jgi:diguanylate cyclase